MAHHLPCVARGREQEQKCQECREYGSDTAGQKGIDKDIDEEVPGKPGTHQQQEQPGQARRRKDLHNHAREETAPVPHAEEDHRAQQDAASEDCHRPSEHQCECCHRGEVKDETLFHFRAHDPEDEHADECAEKDVGVAAIQQFSPGCMAYRNQHAGSNDDGCDADKFRCKERA